MSCLVPEVVGGGEQSKGFISGDALSSCIQKALSLLVVPLSVLRSTVRCPGGTPPLMLLRLLLQLHALLTPSFAFAAGGAR